MSNSKPIKTGSSATVWFEPSIYSKLKDYQAFRWYKDKERISIEKAINELCELALKQVSLKVTV